MIITCRNCNTSFNLSDELVKDTGSQVKCSKCNYIFKVFPPHIQNGPELHQSEDDLGFEEDQQEAEEQSFLPRPNVERDWDLSEIEKILQEENGKIFGGDTLESAKNQEEYDDFEFDDLDDLFGKEDITGDQKKEKDLTVSNKGSDSERIHSEKTAIEDIDLSELDDFFKEDGEWEEKLPKFDADSNLLNLESDLEEEKTSDFNEPEDVEKIENIDLSELDDLFREDKISPLQAAESLKDPEIIMETDNEEISLPEGSNKKTEDINLSEIDEFFINEIANDDLNSNLEMETKDNNKHDQVSEKIDDGINFDFDLEMEKDSSDDLGDDNSAEKFEIDFDFAEKDQDHLLEIESTDINYGLKDDKKGLLDAENSANEKLNFKDLENKDNITEFDEEFDLSDLEEIIDLEEENGTETKSVKLKDEDQEIEFDLALEPDNEEDTSIKVILDGEELYVDAPETPVETKPEYPEKIEETDFEFEMAENIEEASLTEKDDYNLEENQGKFHNVFDTVTLIDTTHQDERDDDVDIEDEQAKPESRVGKIIALVILIFILLASVGYGIFSVFNVTGSQIPIIGSYLNKEMSDPGNIKMVAFDLNSKFEENQHAGKIFIITGIIKNEYSEPRSFIKVTGKLYEPTKKLSHTEQVYAGNVFSELELRNLDLEAIKNRLSNRLGQNKSNIKIGPGQSVPFVIIFSNLPQQLEEFTVEIESSSPA
jgi:pilus assembly protein FimV